MSLKITKQRTINAEFNVVEEGTTVLVKQTYISIDENAVSSVQENLLNAELYAKYRKQMRKDEQELRNLRYKIEDEILAESNGTDGIFGLFDVVRDFYAHGIDEHPWVLILVIIIFSDIAVGVSRAWAAHELSSTKFRKGVVSHTAMTVFVAMFYPFANFMNLTSIVDTFIFAMIAAYTSSILASLSALGVEIPFIDKYVKMNIDKDKFNLTPSDKKGDRRER